LFLVYFLGDSEPRPSLLYSKGELHNANLKQADLTGSYFVLIFWHPQEMQAKFGFSWNTEEKSSENIDFKLLASVLVPCFVFSLAILCGYSCFRRRKSRRRQRVSYQVISRSDLMNDSFVDNYFPVKYYLSGLDEICPICFDV
jgi:hypothetical protein